MKFLKSQKTVIVLGNVIIVGLFVLLIVYWYSGNEKNQQKFAIDTNNTFAINTNYTFVVDINDTFVEETDSFAESKKKAASIKILCMMLTYPANHFKKAIHAKKTWGEKCDVFLMMSSKYDKELDNVALNVSEGRDLLWNKVKKSFKYVYDNYYDKIDWFYKADDDTFAIMPNMKLMLSNYNTTDPLYFGRHFKTYVKNGYMSGGSGYVLSKEALKRLKEKNFCEHLNGKFEDVEMGRCMQQLKVTAGDSRDEQGHETFLPVSVTNSISVAKDSFVRSYSKYKVQEGLNCCSDHLIASHYITPDAMYEYNYFIYHVKIAKDFKKH